MYLCIHSCGGPNFRISRHENQPAFAQPPGAHSINIIVVVVVTILIIISAKTWESIGNQPAFAHPASCPQAFLSTFRIFTSQPKSLYTTQFQMLWKSKYNALQWRSDFQSGSRVLKGVLSTYSFAYLIDINCGIQFIEFAKDNPNLKIADSTL